MQNYRTDRAADDTPKKKKAVSKAQKATDGAATAKKQKVADARKEEERQQELLAERKRLKVQAVSETRAAAAAKASDARAVNDAGPQKTVISGKQARESANRLSTSKKSTRNPKNEYRAKSTGRKREFVGQETIDFGKEGPCS